MASAVAAALTKGITLHTGTVMPFVGLGTWKAEKGVVAKAVEEALRLGYRHIDCACDYGNEQEVAEGIKAAISAGICKRADIFVTTKLWNTYHAREHVRPACERSLRDLGLDYIDLYLIHFPISLKYVPFETRYPPEWTHDPKAEKPRMELADVPIRETWEAMEKLVDDGLAKHIGVSNFNCQSLMDLLKYARIHPAVNQVELHPYLVQEGLVEFCKSRNVSVTAYSPLGAGSYVSLKMAQPTDNVLHDPVMLAIAQKHHKSTAQVALRWGIQRGCTVIPKSSQAERIAANSQVFDFELSPEDMSAISCLNRNRRFNDPGVYTRFMNNWYPIFD